MHCGQLAGVNRIERAQIFIPGGISGSVTKDGDLDIIM